MSLGSQIIPWLIILIPFLVLAYSYDSLTEPVLIARDFFGDGVTVAPKSLLSVFRVPLIEVVCAAAIEIMRRRFAKPGSTVEADYYLTWTILLYTVAVKSLLQAIETVLPADFSHYLYYMTLVAVVGGILTAAIVGRKVLSDLRSFTTGTYHSSDLVALAALLLAYLGLAFVPVYIFE